MIVRPSVSAGGGGGTGLEDARGGVGSCNVGVGVLAGVEINVRADDAELVVENPDVGTSTSGVWWRSRSI